MGALGLLVATLSVRLPLPTLAVVAGLAVAAVSLQNLPWALGLFTVLTFFERISGLGGSVTLVKLVSAALFVAWIGVLAGRRWTPVLFRDHPVLSYVALALVVWAGASSLWAADAGSTTSDAFRLVQMLFLVFLAFSAIAERGALRLFGWAFIGGAVLTTIVGLSSGRIGSHTSARFGGDFGNPNNLAAVVLPGLALAGFMLIASRRALERRLLAGCGMLLLLTLLLTQSRGGLIGLGAMCLAALLFGGPARARALVLVLLVVGGSLAYFTTVASSSARHRATDFSVTQSTGRVDLWSVGWQMSRDHPVRGVGFGNFTVVAPTYLERDLDLRRSDLILRPTAAQVHNLYLNVLAELGVVGLLVFMGLLAGVFGIAVRATRILARAGDVEGELLARGLVIGACGMLTAYFFFSAQFEKQLWLVLGSLVALSTLADAARRGATQDRRRPSDPSPRAP
jgi:O-antigen ligase